MIGTKDSSQRQALTGTPNSQCDLIDTLHNSLQWATNLGQYIQDAQQDGDNELTSFFQKLQQEESERLVTAKHMLVSRFGDISSAVGSGGGGGRNIAGKDSPYRTSQ